MFMKKISAFLVFTICLITSCKNTTTRQALVFKNADDTIAFKMVSIDTALNNCKLESGKCAEISIMYPIFLTTDTVLNNFLNAEVLLQVLKNLNLDDSTVAPSITIGIANFFAEYISETKEYGQAQPWSLAINVAPQGRYNNIYCIQTFNDSYLGGAHPNNFTQYINYNTTSLTRVNTKDFVDIQNPNFIIMGEQQFVKENNMQGEYTLKDAGFFWGIGDDTTKKEGQFYFNENMFIKKDSIGFYYNPYEIAAYVFGPTTVTLPIKKTQQFFKK
jgi:Protein of unknown function (DUF3298)/Deacetylase PdaC